jgi:PAS domain S-box-containing protein
VLRKGGLVERDFHRDPGSPEINLGIDVPLRAGPGKPIFAAMIFEIDPREYTAALQKWPVPTRSAELLLVRRDGDSVLYLVDVKGWPGSALNYRIPMSNTGVAAVMAARGAKGNFEALDYRGVPIFAAVRPVPGTPWYLIAKIDSEEVWEPLRRGSTLLGITAISLGLGLSALLYVLWRRHQLRVYRELCESAEAHRALAEQYECLSRYANDVILLLDANGVIVRANDRAAEVYGYPIDEVVGKSVCELRAPQAQASFAADWHMAGKRDSTLYESLHCSRDGREFPVEISMRALKMDERFFRQAIIRDVSERKLAQKGLRESEARLRQLVENTPFGLMVVDGLEIVYVNPAARKLFGAKREGELVGCSVLQFVAAADRAGVIERARKFRCGSQLPMVERRYTRLDGREFWASVWATAIEYNECPATLLFYQDTTGEKQAAEQRAVLEEELRQAQKMESVGRLAGGVAHDFNNYLTVINGYCDMLLAEGGQSGEVRDGLREIRSAGERAASVTMQLLTFSRKQRASPRPICLNQSVVESGKLLSRLIGSRIQIATHLGENLPLVMADPGQIDQLLMNLTLNARDSMAAGGVIDIGTSAEILDAGGALRNPSARPGEYVVLSVSDTGTGMEPELRSKIFEPFFTTKGAGHGTGLGLCTAYGIVQQAGGWFEVESAPGEGAKFQVWLPVTGIAEQADDLIAARPGAIAARKEATLLIVEDRADVRRLAMSILQLEGYHLLESECADDALAVSECYAGEIDLLVTDVVMPGMTGCELADRLVARRPGLKVLYMSGYSGEAIVAEGALDAGTDYLAKPFTPEQLTGKVRGALRAPAGEGRTILVIDDDIAVSNLLRRILSGGGYRVLVASDGKMGVDVLERQPVDLVITDLVMPGQEGLETVSYLHEQRPNLPVIAISGAFGGSFLKAAGLLGAAATLGKPIAPETLLETVGRLVMEAEAPAVAIHS